MKAIILSAGQGRRLLPLTEDDPKCLLPVDGDRPLLEVQLRALAQCGVRSAVVMVGFRADRVERFLESQSFDGMEVRTIYNPFYRMTDNLVTCWLARPEMTEDFLVLNGDTLFEIGVLRRLLAAPPAPVTVTINQKASYDDDDMKVSLNGSRTLRAVGKALPPSIVDGESIGLISFRSAGARAFREALDEAIRRPGGLRAWYLSVVNDLAARLPVATASIDGMWWGEVDSVEDLSQVRAAYEARAHDRSAPRVAAIDSLSWSDQPS